VENELNVAPSPSSCKGYHSCRWKRVGSSGSRCSLLPGDVFHLVRDFLRRGVRWERHRLPMTTLSSPGRAILRPVIFISYRPPMRSGSMGTLSRAASIPSLERKGDRGRGKTLNRATTRCAAEPESSSSSHRGSSRVALPQWIVQVF